MTHRPRSAARLAKEAVITVGAVLGVVCIVAALAAVLLGVRPLVVQSGSMSPAIDTGDLALARTVPAADLATKDVVVVETSGGQRVMHRIVEVRTDGGQAQLTLKGDANGAVDAETYAVTETPRVFGHLPFLGRVVAFFSSSLGLFALGMYAAVLLAVVVRRPDEARDDDREDTDDDVDGPDPSGPPRERDRGGRRKAARATVSTALAIAVLGASPAVAAPWTDEVAVNGSTLATQTLLPPASVACALVAGNNSVNITWPHRDVRYDYEVVVLNDANAQVGATAVVVGAGAAGSTQTRVVNRGLTTSTTFLGLREDYSVVIRSRLKSNIAWKSATTIVDGVYEERPLFGNVASFRIFCT